MQTNTWLQAVCIACQCCRCDMHVRSLHGMFYLACICAWVGPLHMALASARAGAAPLLEARGSRLGRLERTCVRAPSRRLWLHNIIQPYGCIDIDRVLWHSCFQIPIFDSQWFLRIISTIDIECDRYWHQYCIDILFQSARLSADLKHR